MLFVLLFILIISTLSIAQEVTVIDNDTISISDPQKISVLTDRLKYLRESKERSDAQFDDQINKIQSSIDSAAEQGAEGAIASSSLNIKPK